MRNVNGTERWEDRNNLDEREERLLSKYFDLVDGHKAPLEKRARSESPSPVVTYSPRLVKVRPLC